MVVPFGSGIKVSHGLSISRERPSLGATCYYTLTTDTKSFATFSNILLSHPPFVKSVCGPPGRDGT